MTKITALAAASLPLDPTDLVEVIQQVGAGPINKKVPVSDLRAGLTHTYVGTTTPGSSTSAPASGTLWLAKKITLSAASLIASVGARLSTGGSVGRLGVCVWSDNAGAVADVLAVSGHLATDSLHKSAGAAWVHVPVGLWAPAGDYWVGIAIGDGTSNVAVAYDATGGTDHHVEASGAWTTPGPGTATTNNYSIRASVLT